MQMSRSIRSISNNGKLTMRHGKRHTEPEKTGWGGPGSGLGRRASEFVPLGSNGVCGLDILSWLLLSALIISMAPHVASTPTT